MEDPSRPTMLEFGFRNPTFEGQDTNDKYDLLLGITATFELSVDGHVIYTEELFTIAELRAALLVWLSGPMPQHKDFEFDSMEAENPGLVWIRWHDDKGWLVGSIFETNRATRLFTDAEVSDAIEQFNSDVARWAKRKLQVALPNDP